MPWLQVETATGQADTQALETALEELGAVAVFLRDAGDSPILEPAPGKTPLWPDCIVTALFPATTVATQLRAELEALLPAADWLLQTIDDRNWQADWDKSLVPLCFGDRLWVLPGNTEAPPGSAVVRLDPGLAFGSGEHATTAMCLNWLARQPLAGTAVLDYGCGSGLLAIAALKLGASRACAVDIDPQALTATRLNAHKNDCAQQLQIAQPEELAALEQYDVLVANILSGTLIELSAVLRSLLKPGAPVAVAGILAEQAADVRAAWAHWADLTVSAQQGNWVLLSGAKHAKRN